MPTHAGQEPSAHATPLNATPLAQRVARPLHARETTPARAETQGGRGAGNPALEACRVLKASIGEAKYRRYFDGSLDGSQDGSPSASGAAAGDGRSLLRYEEGSLRVLAPSAFVADVLVRRFGAELARAAEVAGCAYEVRVDEDAFLGAVEAEDAEAAQGEQPAARRPVQDRSRGDRAGSTRYALEHFVVGESNRLAYGAAERLAASEGPSEFSPLFIHGPCGVGKTHLLQGVASRHRRLFPSARVRYTTAESFTNGYIAAVREGGIDAFRGKHRGLDLLCIDDVHFFGSKEQTQSELLHTLDAIGLDGAKIVLASDEPPAKIEKLGRSLASRFAAGAVVELGAPDRALQLALLRSIAARRGLVMEDAAVQLLADRAARLGEAVGGASVRDLEGMMTQIEAVHRLLPELRSKGGGVGLTLVRRALGLDTGDGTGVGARPAANRRPIRLEQIRGEICRQLGVTDSELMGRGRHKRVVLARALFVELGRRMTTHSYPEIGRALARVNHSTVVTAHQRIRKQITEGETLAVGGSFDGLSYAEAADRFEGFVRRAVAAGQTD